MIDPRQKPGTIPAENINTKVCLRVRPDMLVAQHNTLQLREITEAEFQERMNPDKEADVSAEKVEAAPPAKTDDSGSSDDGEAAITTATGKPFKTEAAAKSAMKKKELAAEDYLVLPVEGGFIITRI